MPSVPVSNPPVQKRSRAEIAAMCAAAATICLPLTSVSEGLRNRPYLDPAHILTVCYGETEHIDPAKIYSNDECATMLRRRLAEDYAPRVLECLPELWDQRYVKVFGALLDAAYNAGSVAVCRSRMAVAIHAGDWVKACDGFEGWYTTARDRKTGARIALRGLVIRRGKEADLCREGVANASINGSVRADEPGMGPVAPDRPVGGEPPRAARCGFWQRLKHVLGLGPRCQVQPDADAVAAG